MLRIPRLAFFSRVMGLLATVLLVSLSLGACGGSNDDKVLYIGGIPDQNVSLLTRRFGDVADYLSRELGLKVKYLPSANYAAVVTAFEKGDLHLGWFGGLTGVQARAVAPGSMAVAQRPIDEEFHSEFIVQAGIYADGLADLKGLTFTFGSESSTSGHLMPRYYLTQAGIDPDRDFNGPPGYSGSHDKTWKLVEIGAYKAGVLSQAVWERAVSEGAVDVSKVNVIYTTPAYYDYNWSVRGDLDGTFGQGFTQRLTQALLSMGPRQAHTLSLFATDRFIATSNDNYEAIRQVAQGLGIIQ